MSLNDLRSGKYLFEVMGCELRRDAPSPFIMTHLKVLQAESLPNVRNVVMGAEVLHDEMPHFAGTWLTWACGSRLTFVPFANQAYLRLRPFAQRPANLDLVSEMIIVRHDGQFAEQFDCSEFVGVQVQGQIMRLKLPETSGRIYVHWGWGPMEIL